MIVFVLSSFFVFNDIPKDYFPIQTCTCQELKFLYTKKDGHAVVMVYETILEFLGL